MGKIYEEAMAIENANHSHQAPLHVNTLQILMDLQKDDEAPAEKHPKGKFGPPETKDARDLADEAAHSHKVPRHNPKAEDKPQPIEPFFPVDTIANISAHKRKTTK